MRSMLFVPGDSDKKLAKGADSGADAIIADLEDSVAPSRKSEGRRLTRDYLASPRSGRQLRYVRINPLSTEYALDDLAAVVGGAPDGIMLPKCNSADDLRKADHFLSALEAREGLPPGRIAILPIITETAPAMFNMGGYAGVTTRLAALMWGAEDLAADVGASANRNLDLTYLPPFELARSLCLHAASSAGVPAIETPFTDFRNTDGLKVECEAGERMGFSGKAAIHPGQVETINRAFTPRPEAVAWARKIVEAFAANPGMGVIGIDGKMIDKPHLRAAERVLKRAG